MVDKYTRQKSRSIFVIRIKQSSFTIHIENFKNIIYILNRQVV